MDTAARLERLSLITRDCDESLRSIRDVLSRPVGVDGRADVEHVLSNLARDGRSHAIPKSLDLIGHSTPDRSLLILGDWVVDGTRAKVVAFFRGLADAEIFERTGIRQIRLLGCETALSHGGRHTLVTLAEVTGLEVLGTTQSIDVSSYDAGGFVRDAVLASSNDARREARPVLVGEPYRRVLDVDGLPASPLGALPAHPRKLADVAAARQVLALIRRADGAQMPGFSTTSCELALPSAKPSWYHRVQIIGDGEFVRVFPDGDHRPGVMFPVLDSRKLVELVATLPAG